MRIGLVPDTLLERLALMLGIVPTPVLYTVNGPILARMLFVATRLRIFEALAVGSSCAERIAASCQTDVGATRTLLNALTAAAFLRRNGDGYSLAPIARKWLLEESPSSVRDGVLFSAVALEHLEGLEDFVRRGEPLDIHRAPADSEMWPLYQRGMRALASLSASEVGARTWVPAGAHRMLDIGGAHGLYSVALCKRHPGLSSVILDLPAAVEHAVPLLEREGMGGRVRHRPGDALKDDLGVDCFDLVLISQLTHHFDEDTNRGLVRRVSRALRPGGALVIQEVFRQGASCDQMRGLLDLCFALTSRSGTWSYDEIAAWQRDAELVPRKPLRLRTLPGGGQQTAIKPSQRR